MYYTFYIILSYLIIYPYVCLCLYLCLSIWSKNVAGPSVVWFFQAPQAPQSFEHALFVHSSAAPHLPRITDFSIIPEHQILEKHTVWSNFYQSRMCISLWPLFWAPSGLLAATFELEVWLLMFFWRNFHKSILPGVPVGQDSHLLGNVVVVMSHSQIQPPLKPVRWILVMATTITTNGRVYPGQDEPNHTSALVDSQISNWV